MINFVTASFLTGYGASILHLASTDAVNIYFSGRGRDNVFAALILSFGLSILVSPILLECLIIKLSFQHALIIFSVFNIISIPTALLYYHAVRDPTKSRDDKQHLLEKPTNTKDYGTGTPIVSDNNGGEDISNDTHLEDCGSNESYGKSKAEAETE